MIDEYEIGDYRQAELHNRLYMKRLSAHPDCRDPDHPGCVDCDEIKQIIDEGS